jgi:hypothetical protein
MVGERFGMSGSSDQRGEEVREVERELRERALLLANLEVIMEDYRREKSKLIEEVMALREKLWDLKGQTHPDDSSDEASG